MAIGANKCRIRKLDIIKDFLKQSPAERPQEFPEEPGRELHRHLRKHLSQGKIEPGTRANLTRGTF